MKRGGKVWINIFPHKPITKKPAEVRMGSGKGNVEYYVAVVKPGRILFEISGVSEDIAREAMRKAGHKLPMKQNLLRGIAYERKRFKRAISSGIRNKIIDLKKELMDSRFL